MTYENKKIRQPPKSFSAKKYDLFGIELDRLAKLIWVRRTLFELVSTDLARSKEAINELIDNPLSIPPSLIQVPKYILEIGALDMGNVKNDLENESYIEVDVRSVKESNLTIELHSLDEWFANPNEIYNDPHLEIEASFFSIQHNPYECFVNEVNGEKFSPEDFYLIKRNELDTPLPVDLVNITIDVTASDQQIFSELKLIIDRKRQANNLVVYGEAKKKLIKMSDVINYSLLAYLDLKLYEAVNKPKRFARKTLVHYAELGKDRNESGYTNTIEPLLNIIMSIDLSKPPSFILKR
ncbi:DUF6387 family protein [Thiosulfativibrio zosterae]|nr:DUF6387 family protein [Thiosulfativibrio zosterae]